MEYIWLDLAFWSVTCLSHTCTWHICRPLPDRHMFRAFFNERVFSFIVQLWSKRELCFLCNNWITLIDIGIVPLLPHLPKLRSSWLALVYIRVHNPDSNSCRRFLGHEIILSPPALPYGVVFTLWKIHDFVLKNHLQINNACEIQCIPYSSSHTGIFLSPTFQT